MTYCSEIIHADEAVGLMEAEQLEAERLSAERLSTATEETSLTSYREYSNIYLRDELHFEQVICRIYSINLMKLCFYLCSKLGSGIWPINSTFLRYAYF